MNSLIERLESWIESGSEGDVITQFYIDITEAITALREKDCRITELEAERQSWALRRAQDAAKIDELEQNNLDLIAARQARY